MTLTVITNDVPREVIEAWELSADERAEFDYLNWDAIDCGEESASFVRYKGDLINLGDVPSTREILACGGAGDLRAWDGYLSDSYFSVIVVRYCADSEYVVVGRYLS